MQLKPLLSRLFELGSNLIRRYPGTVALFGFISGVASFVLVERHAGLAKVVALVMLVSWLWLVLESSLRRSLQRWFGWQVPQPLLRYATQMVHQESLFFIIPFFAITTTWNSGQALFTGLLGLAALVSLIDPLYYKWLAPRRWVYLGFHALTLFAVLLTALPSSFTCPPRKATNSPWASPCSWHYPASAACSRVWAGAPYRASCCWRWHWVPPAGWDGPGFRRRRSG